MKSVAPLLIVSIVVALAGFAQPIFFPWPDSPLRADSRTFLPAGVWVLLLIAGLTIHGKRGLWLLVGAPLALFWPAVLTNLYLGSWLGRPLLMHLHF